MKVKLITALLCLTMLICSAFVLMKPPKKPSLFLIGDSTVRNGTYGRGDGGLWGWGSFIHLFLDTTKISVQNRAMGGTSSHSYAKLGLWDKAMADIKEGDFLLIQFGHNDNGKYAIKNNSEDTMQYLDPKNGDTVIVHSYGWNLRRYIREARSKGATPIVLSLVPRNSWKDGKITRNTNDFVLWARQAAEQESVAFIDLNAIVCDRYEKDSEEKVKAVYFGKDHVHTLEAGAKVNAACVASGLRNLPGKPFRHYLLKKSLRND